MATSNKAPGSRPAGFVAKVTVGVARFALRALPSDRPGRFGSALCAFTGAAVLASVRRSVTVGGLAAGAATATALLSQRDHQVTGPVVVRPEEERLARWVVAWSKRRRLHATCLPRSLALWVVLQHNGHPARYCMGASKHSTAEPSHAWVECHGEPVLEGADPRERYVRFDLGTFYPPELVGD